LEGVNRYLDVASPADQTPAEGPEHCAANGESDGDSAKLAEEAAYFRSIVKRLLNDTKYRDAFVAIKDRKIIDSDQDEMSLVERICQANPNEVVFIGRVAVETPTFDVSSPELSP